ncbi:hypothetical protein D3C78_1345480 [compost metagenome]
MVEKTCVDGRHERQVRDVTCGDGGGELGQLQARHQVQAGAGRDHRHQVGDAHDVCQRGDAVVTVRRIDPARATEDAAQGEQAAMPVHDRLGPTGSAGGEDEQTDAICRVFRLRFGGRVRVDGGKSQRARQQAVDHGRSLARGVLGAGGALCDGKYGDTRLDQRPQAVQLRGRQPCIHHGGPGP